MPRVPEKILVGPTAYVHLRRKNKDYYVPDFLSGADDPSASPPSPGECEHMWRYSVSKEHHNTVFFFNAMTRKSVWVLPVVHRDGRTEPLAEGEVMRAIRSETASDGGAEAGREAADDELGETHVDGREGGSDACEKLEIDVTDTGDASPLLYSSVAPPLISTKDGSPRGAPSATADLPAVEPPAKFSLASQATVERKRVQAAVQRAREAKAQRTFALPSTIAEGGHHKPTLQERLAAWRARQRYPATQAEAQPPQASTVESPTTLAAVTTEKPPVVVEDPYAYVMSSTLPMGGDCGSSSAPGALQTEKNAAQPYPPDGSQWSLPACTQPSAAASASTDTEFSVHAPAPKHAQSATMLSGAPLGKLAEPTIEERELAEAASLLHREKIAAMQQEMAALECRRRALAVEQAEAEECARLAQARAAAERARLQEVERVTREQAQLRASLEASAAAELRAREVNDYLSKKRQLQEAAESAVANSFTYASRIAAELAAAAPRPENISIPTAGRLQKEVSEESARLTPPHYRAHQVGRVSPTVAGLPVASPASREKSPRGSAKCRQASVKARALRGTLSAAPTSAKVPTALRRQQRLAYTVPHLYEGDVITYRPSRSFTGQGALTEGAAAIMNQAARARCSSTGPAPPLVLSAKRDGAGTQYYDAARQHFFRGTWHEDKRDGTGVLSLPTTAVQGRWRADELAGPAVLQTRHSKGIVSFVSGNSAGGAQAPGTGPSRASHTSSTAAGTATLTGNAVVELDNKALFVGALKEGRARAPYVLQLGQGDYIEWLGAPAHREGCARLPAGKSAELLKHTPTRVAPLPSTSASMAGSGECRIRFRNGDTYVGHVYDFQLHGFGYYRFAEDGHSYTGRFEAGWPHGEGLLIFANGDVYRGGFVKGLFDGHGTFTSEKGQYVYEGRWVAGAMDGQGSLAFANGDVWTGTFEDNKRVAGAYTTLA
ncbi:hypothetical protein LSCM1_06398 [Leishmania martiniquensis]|uniref:WW domain-containing protein n=1 Tax=Leishmania martiniquensis TaxID=1580590 RepID=A0A836GVP2_9TRYP|nr:hypothetical protein LSCM1_06398 [Leishmania martiniquensis]